MVDRDFGGRVQQNWVAAGELMSMMGDKMGLKNTEG